MLNKFERRDATHKHHEDGKWAELCDTDATRLSLTVHGIVMVYCRNCRSYFTPNRQEVDILRMYNDGFGGMSFAEFRDKIINKGS